MVDRSALRRGDVYWLEAPDTPRRPACVLSRDAALPYLSRVVVVTATTNVRGIPTEVPVGPEDGLPTTSVLALDNIERVPPAYLQAQITTLSQARMLEICRALAIATGC